MKIKSGNIGMLKSSDIKSGDKILMYDEPKENNFSFKNDKGELIEGMDWRVKIFLPDRVTKKLAIIPARCHDDILEVYGDETSDFIGRTLVCEINTYNKITFKPTNDLKVENPNSPLSDEEKQTLEKLRENEVKKQEQTFEEIYYPSDIPF